MAAFLQRNQWKIYLITALLLILFLISFIVFVNVSHSASQPNVSPASISQPDALTVTVALHRDVAQTTKVVYTHTLANPTVVNHLYQEIASGYIVKPGDVYHCPAMSTTYYSYAIDFQQKGKTIIQASSNATGCAFWTVKDIVHATQTTHTTGTDNLWSDLHKYTGTPEPSQAFHA
jgi:hypothetical protein